MTDLPAVIAEIADVAGMDAAWALAGARGGTTVFIPAEAGPDHWLTELVGQEAANKICKHFRDTTAEGSYRGRRLLVPMASEAQRQAAWEKALDSGNSLTETARIMNVHERTVVRHRKKRRERDQGSLF